MNEKVTILTPCYNVEKYISKFLDSIIEQDYRPIELILVNDGSPDKTKDVIEEYAPKIKKSEIDFIYLEKENGGQASAIAYGLPYVTGTYLTWPDSDDFLLPNSITKRVEYFKNNPDCAMLRSNGYIYNEDDLKNPIFKISKITKKAFFDDFITFSIPWVPGCYMIKMSDFDRANPKRQIFKSKCGQNIQMIIPVVYYNDCHYLDEYLFGYVIHNSSHSRSNKTYFQEKTHIENLRECMQETLKVIPENTDKYLQKYNNFILHCLYKNAWNYHEKKEKKNIKFQLKSINEYSLEERIMYVTKPSKTNRVILRLISFIKRKFQIFNIRVLKGEK